MTEQLFDDQRGEPNAALVRTAPPGGLPAQPAAAWAVPSYQMLADVFRTLLSEHSLDALLEGIVSTLAELIPYDSLSVYRADESQRLLIPIVARDKWADEILNDPGVFGEGVTGWAAEHREAVLSNEVHLDPRAEQIPGTPEEPEALMSIPLIARDSIKGVLNVYRLGDGVSFSAEEFEMAKHFADAAALALDNADIRRALELQAQTDALTGLFNHRFFHERLRSELTRASRTRDSVALIVFDLDDFKRVNDIHGHATGDQVLVALAEIVRSTVRASDIVSRIGGEEFAVIMPSCGAGDAHGLATRLNDRLAVASFDPADRLTVSAGIAEGPAHAMNSRELFACAEAAMMTAKASGKNRIVLFEDASERPQMEGVTGRDVRSLAHMKMLQNLAGKLNRLNDVREIANVVAHELRTLIDYHNCRVYMRRDDALVPIAFVGHQTGEYGPLEVEICPVGEGFTGRVAETGEPLLLANALDCDFAVDVEGTDEIDESILAVPLKYGARVIGAIVVSKLGIGQFDEDDLRLLEVLAGNASVALENARLYEAQRQEARHAKALLEFADAATKAHSYHAIGDETVRMAAKILEVGQAALWLQNEYSGDYRCVSHTGFVGDPEAEPLARARWSESVGHRFLGGRREPFVLTAAETEQLIPVPDGVRLRDIAIAPVSAGNGTNGWICVGHPDRVSDHFTEERMLLLAGLSSHASVALQKALLYKEQKESAEIASRLLDFSRELAAAEELEDVLERTVELSARILGSPKTQIWLQDPRSGEMKAEAAWGLNGRERQKVFAARLDRDMVSKFLAVPSPFVLAAEAYEAIPATRELSFGVSSAVAAMKLEGGRMGCLVAHAPATGDYNFSERKLRLLEGLGNQARLAINNAFSFDSLEQTFLDTVEALANALEAKDEYTSTHARWITDAALEVGRELGMGHRDLKRLELGALFHDIGKIGIPSDILLKPGPLDDHEWEIVRMHPELGERILSPIMRLSDVRPIVRACHEHFDGTGYPDGKRATEIPMEARIILVVDAFHAMTTDRPYRKRLPIGEACRRLADAAGIQFDPDVVRVFMGLIECRPELAETA
ncbi:MAG: diguanylate cyclase [Actinomycetota bacterium]